MSPVGNQEMLAGKHSDEKLAIVLSLPELIASNYLW